jgi:phosphoglycolate phosphatase
MARAVIGFDLDGTLIDSAPDIHDIACQVLDVEGFAPITLKEARSFVGKGAAHFVAQMRAARGIADSEQDRLLAAYLARYEGAVARTRLYPEVRGALEELLGEGHRLVLCTNKPERPTKFVLDHFDLASFFDVVVGGDTLPQRKPDPLPLLAAFGDVSGPRLFVGDSDIDAATAQAAEVPFLLFTEGYLKSEPEEIPHAARFERFSSLPGLVQKMTR